MPSRTLKCRFCPWETPVETRVINGKEVSAWARLQRHLYHKHEDEYRRIRRWLDDVSTDPRRSDV